MARILQDRRATEIRNVAVDERTSVLLDPDGNATVVGAGHRYFQRSNAPPEVCRPNTPLTFRNIEVHALSAHERFDVKNWTTPTASPTASP